MVREMVARLRAEGVAHAGHEHVRRSDKSPDRLRVSRIALANGQLRVLHRELGRRTDERMNLAVFIFIFCNIMGCRRETIYSGNLS